MSVMDLESALGGGMPPGGGMMPAGPEGEPVPGEEPPEGGSSSLEFLLTAEEALQEFISVDPDDADRAKASQALKIILDLKAANTQDAREGGMKSLSRALAGGA